MRAFLLALATVVGLAASSDSDPSCPARVESAGGALLHWIAGPPEDRNVLAQWCRGVGAPVYLPKPARDGGPPPALHDVVVVTWNAHLHEGRLSDLVEALWSGELTGQPVRHFVLLVQELFRRGPEVPSWAPGWRSARAIRAGEADDAPDVNEHAATLGLSMLYVPSMRNGAELFEDRGNAILSTEPLSNAFTMELPFERQRRVAVGASLDVTRDGLAATLRVVNVHLEPLSAPGALWIFRNPRTRQMDAVLDMLTASQFEIDVTWAGTVLGGDFNTVKAGADEWAYRAARAWAASSSTEDRRATHRLGRLDYLLYRLPEGWRGSARRIEKKFGSDHHPVLGQLTS